MANNITPSEMAEQVLGMQMLARNLVTQCNVLLRALQPLVEAEPENETDKKVRRVFGQPKEESDGKE